MFKKTLSTKIILLGLVTLAVFLGDLKFKQYKNQKAIEANIVELKNQEAAQEQKSNELSQSLSYFGSADFKEKVARQQLGYKRSGENVYGFIENQNQSGSATQPVQVSITNPQKWWKYFFGQ